jgi:hypothetical protein
MGIDSMLLQGALRQGMATLQTLEASGSAKKR